MDNRIDTPKMDNNGIIQQRFKYHFGQNFMVLRPITRDLRDFTVTLVLRLYWESLSSLHRKVLATTSSTCQNSIATNLYLLHIKKHDVTDYSRSNF